MKKLFCVLLLLAGASGFRALAQAPVSDKAVLMNIHAIGTDKAAVKATRDFWLQVGDQKQEQWYKEPQGYLAEYTEGRTKALYRYDPKGNWLFSILTYSEKELPENVRTLVLSHYFDYKISWAKEVRNDQTTVYVVHLETATEWKDVAVQDGEMRILHEYNF